MCTDKLLREYDHGMFLQEPKLPPRLDGNIHLFEFNSDRLYAAEWFFSLLDELKKAHDKTPQGLDAAFNQSKTLMLEAWYQHRLFGLYMSETDSLFNNCRGHDAYIMTRTGSATAKYIFPLFCIVDATGAARVPRQDVPEHDDKDDGCIKSLWVAERARGVGLGQHMVAAMNCYAVENPLFPLFWHKMGYTINPSEGATRKSVGAYSWC
jgi:GNAT superfamily N-acetyltransferase